jgi:hypothetical protein
MKTFALDIQNLDQHFRNYTFLTIRYAFYLRKYDLMTSFVSHELV